MSTVSWSLIAAALPAVLRSWFSDVRSGSLTVQGEPAEIGNSNLWTFGLEDEQRRSLTADDVSSFLRAIAALWRDAAAPLGTTEWMFYAWHDEMSGRLRFSACPARKLEELPFACTLRGVQVDAVARAFLHGRSVIPRDELQAHLDIPADTLTEFVLDVWAVHL